MNFQKIQYFRCSTIVPCRNTWQVLFALGEFIHLENHITKLVVCHCFVHIILARLVAVGCQPCLTTIVNHAYPGQSGQLSAFGSRVKTFHTRAEDHRPLLWAPVVCPKGCLRFHDKHSHDHTHRVPNVPCFREITTCWVKGQNCLFISSLVFCRCTA